MTIYATRTALPRPSHPQEPDVLLIEDLYCIIVDEGILGFIEKVGNVFVALGGLQYDRAVEVGQSLSWDQTVAMLRHSFFTCS